MSLVAFEKRLEPHLGWQALLITLALVLSAIVTSLLLISAGASPPVAFAAIYEGAFGSRISVINTLLRATPLILTGIAVTVAFKAKIWNIGGDGQLFAGAMASYGAYLLCRDLPPVILVPIILLSGAAGGAALGGLAGYLRSRFSVNEVLSTVMLNYVIRFALSYLLVNNWRDTSSFYQQTPRIDVSAILPIILPGSKLHFGFIIALVMAIAIYVMFRWTSLGYEIRAVGNNPVASRFKGIDVGRTAVTVMLISGALAGLAGVTELFGVHYRLKPDLSAGFGFAGIVVAMLAGLRPLAVIPVAILFAALSTGGVRMQIATGVPSALIFAVQAIILILFLIMTALARYRVKIGG
jgi:simple sugar transport system permease protein